MSRTKGQTHVASFQPGNVAAMTAGGASGALRRWERGELQRPFFQELKAQKLHEIQEVGRLGIATDKLADLLVLHELFQERMDACHTEQDIDGMYRASQELRRLTSQILKGIEVHRTEESAAGGPVLDYDAIRAQMQGANDA